MAEVVVDANVLVGLFDEHDSLHTQATALLARLASKGDVPPWPIPHGCISMGALPSGRVVQPDELP